MLIILILLIQYQYKYNLLIHYRYFTFRPWRLHFDTQYDGIEVLLLNLALCFVSGTSEIQGHCQLCSARPRRPNTMSKITDASRTF